MSHATARPRHAGTSFESQATSAAGSGYESQACRDLSNVTSPAHCHPGQARNAYSQLGGYRAKRQARYVTVGDRARDPFTALSRLPGSGRSQHEPASCQWICQWETWEIWDAGAGRRDVLEISAGREACEAELISRTVQVRVSERT